MTNAMGHGVNQRDLIKMTPEEVDAFLAERHSMTMSTISRDGSIHSVAMWYGFLEGAVAFETKAKAQKVTNLRRDPRISALVESGAAYDELQGVELVGTGVVLDDPDSVIAVGRSVMERYSGPYTDEMRPVLERSSAKRVAIRIDVTRVVSWDHRKLGGAY